MGRRYAVEVWVRASCVPGYVGRRSGSADREGLCVVWSEGRAYIGNLTTVWMLYHHRREPEQNNNMYCWGTAKAVFTRAGCLWAHSLACVSHSLSLLKSLCMWIYTYMNYSRRVYACDRLGYLSVILKTNIRYGLLSWYSKSFTILLFENPVVHDVLN